MPVVSMPTPYINTKRCYLRLPDIGEADAMCEFTNKNHAYLQPWEPSHLPEYMTHAYWQQKIIHIREQFEMSHSCCLNLYEKESDQLIGMVNLSNIIHGCFYSCFLGFKIDQSYQNRGLMTEAVQAVITYAFDTLNLHRISANYMPHNHASAKVLTKCGFTKEGTAKDYLRINDRWENHVLTCLINEKWKNV